MEFEGNVVIEATSHDLWEIISDPEILVECVPGAKEVTKISETKYEGVIERSVAGISLMLDGTVELEELNKPHEMTALASGVDNRTNSRMDATAEMEISEDSDGAVTLGYHIDMQFTGRLASVGARIVNRKIDSDIDTFFSNLQEVAEDV